MFASVKIVDSAVSQQNQALFINKNIFYLSRLTNFILLMKHSIEKLQISVLMIEVHHYNDNNYQPSRMRATQKPQQYNVVE